MTAVTVPAHNVAVFCWGVPFARPEARPMPASTKDIYIQRLARSLEAHGELEFLERLTVEELGLLWSKVARQALQHGMRAARGA